MKYYAHIEINLCLIIKYKLLRRFWIFVNTAGILNRYYTVYDVVFWNNEY